MRRRRRGRKQTTGAQNGEVDEEMRRRRKQTTGAQTGEVEREKTRQKIRKDLGKGKRDEEGKEEDEGNRGIWQ